jgi:membrane protease YdiL (CAAX protease family)
MSLLPMIALSLPITGFLVHGDSLSAQVGREGIFWILTLLLLAYVRFIERRPLSSIGLRRPDWKTALLGVVGALAMVAGMAAIYMVVFPALGLSTDEATMGAVRSTPLWFRVILILRAAVFEEILYRGFMIERLAELTRVRWLAALISVTVFTLAHLGGWAWPHLMIAGFGGIVLTALYLCRRDLVSNMTAHFLVDAVGFLLG